MMVNENHQDRDEKNSREGKGWGQGGEMRRLYPVPEPSWAGKAPLYAWDDEGQWPSRWVRPEGLRAPSWWVGRLRFESEKAERVRLFVSADEKYELWLDGKRVGRGPHRSDPWCWPYDGYEMELGAGGHVLVVRVAWWGGQGALAGMGAGLGWLVAADKEEDQGRFNTGHAAWEGMELGGVKWLSPKCAWGTGAKVEVDGARWAWGWERGADEAGRWKKLTAVGEAGGRLGVHAGAGHPRLRAAMIPPMKEQGWKEAKAVAVEDGVAEEETGRKSWPGEGARHGEVEGWDRLLRGEGGLVVEAGVRRRVLIDLGDYACVWPEWVVSGGAGAKLRMNWAESLYETAEGGDRGRKGRRDEWEGKHFVATEGGEPGVGDGWVAEGGAGRKWDTPWWQCGRWAEVWVKTKGEALKVERLTMTETRYPLGGGEAPEGADGRWQGLWRIGRRTLEVCCHETWFDCPYYEQLMYAGDTRLQLLTSYVMTADAQMGRHAVGLFARSLTPEGVTQSRYPSRSRQVIRPFALAWVGMVKDFAWWRDDKEAVRSWLPTVRAVMAEAEARLGGDGILRAGEGWHFVDWATAWDTGVPPCDEARRSAVWHGQWLVALKEAAELEEALGWPELAVRWRRKWDQGVEAANAVFWDEERGMYADDRPGGRCSEHAQVLMVLADGVRGDRLARVEAALCGETWPEGTARATWYFTHYVFEAMQRLGRMEAAVKRLEPWFGLVEQGFCTTPERPEPSRSDCHAWSAHPLFHLVASWGGLRPTAPGFGAWELKPQPAGWEEMRIQVPKPQGGVVEVTIR